MSIPKVSVVQVNDQEVSGYISLRTEEYSHVIFVRDKHEALALQKEMSFASAELKRLLEAKDNFPTQFELAKAMADQQERLEPFDGEGYPGEEKV